MAVAVIGGLISATLMSLVFVPIVYSLLGDGEAWLTRRFRLQPRSQSWTASAAE
jgi:hypothetical protein